MLSVVFVPELRTGKTSGDAAFRWANSMFVGLAPKSQIILFDYSIESNSKSVWQDLIEQGEHLLNVLHADASGFGVSVQDRQTLAN
jgi:hypothetical protein